MPFEGVFFRILLVNGTASLQLYGGQLEAGANTILVSYTGDANYNSAALSFTITATVPTTHSAVAIWFLQNPVPEYPYYGPAWYPVVTLTERAGFSTTLTDFTVGGYSYASQIASLFGGTTLPA